MVNVDGDRIMALNINWAKVRAAAVVALVAALFLFTIFSLTACVKGPTQQEIMQANQIQSQIDQLERRLTEPMLPPLTVEEVEREIAEKESERDELLEVEEIPVGETVGAILPFVPPPFNILGAILISAAPLIFGRKQEPTP